MNFKDAFKSFNPISFVTDVVGTGIDAYAQYKGQQQVFEQQKQLMEQQYENQLDFWNKNNQYNSPANQMKLFEEAGINPYVGISGSNHSTASYGNVMQTPPTPPNYGSVASGAIDRLLSLQMQRTQIAALQADASKKLSDADKNYSDISLNEAQKSSIAVSNRLSAAIAAGHEIRNLYLDEKEKASLQQIFAENNKILADTGKAYAQIELFGSQVSLNQAQYSYIKQLEKLAATRTKLSAAQIDGVIANTALTWSKNRIARVQGDILYETKDDTVRRANAEANEAESRAALTKDEADLLSRSFDDLVKSREFQKLSAQAQAIILQKKAAVAQEGNVPWANSFEAVGHTLGSFVPPIIKFGGE